MKKNHAVLLLAVVFFTCFSASAQLSFLKNSLQNDLSKVVIDQGNHFKNIIGEEIIQNAQTTDYRSLIKVDGSDECIITRYSATGKEIYSWQAIMMKTEDFEAAAKKFKQYFTSLQNLYVSGEGPIMVFKGEYEKPIESLKFNSIIFRDHKNEASKVRLELSMELELLEWVIKIQIYDVEREDHERGATKEQ